MLHSLVVLLSALGHTGVATDRWRRLHGCFPGRSTLRSLVPRGFQAAMKNLTSFSCRYRWQRRLALIVLLVSSELLMGSAGAQERAHPIKIGVLTASWGPPPQVVGLRDGLVELGYRENEQFILGIRFTQGDLTALPAAARELVQYGVDLIVTSEDSPAQAAQRATTRIPI